MSIFDNFFNQAKDETLLVPPKKVDIKNLKIKGPSKEKIFPNDFFSNSAKEISVQLGMPLTGKYEEDIETLEEIFRNLNTDYKNGYLEEPRLTNAGLYFGVYLGDLMLANCLKGHGYKWDVSDGTPRLRKDSDNVINPVSKAYKHIINGDDDDVRNFYKVVEELAKNGKI